MSAATSPVAVVTGAGGMMGGAVATMLASSGARLVVNDRTAQRAARWPSQWSTTGAVTDAPEIVVADVSTSAGAAALAAAAIERWNRIDVLVNVAGGIKGPINNPIWEITDEQWDATLAANIGTTFHCTRQVVPHMMRQRSGKIVNIASIQWTGAAEHAHYVAAKAAVVALTRSVANQLGPYNINVNAIAAGGTLTETQSRLEFPGADEWPHINPLGRPNHPDDIAAAVGFLISEAARNVSGQILNVAGGLNGSL